MALTPDTNVRYLKGVGDKRAALYGKLGIATVGDLLRHFPRAYIDLSSPYAIADAPLGEPCAVRAVLYSKSGEQRIRKGLSIFKLKARDDSGVLELTIYNSKYTVDKLEIDQEYLFYGRITGNLLRREMNTPDIYAATTDARILPVYPQTAGLTTRMIRTNIAQALRELGSLPDPIPPELRAHRHLPGMTASLRDIHFPPDLEKANAARNRFIFEELLVLSCCLGTLNNQNKQVTIPAMEPVELAPFYESLPFSPTNAQLRCINEAAADMVRNAPMNRLIQGDVGSGKTLIAVACAYIAAQNGRQAAMMVPTEILAEQHLLTCRSLLEPLGLRVELLTGSTRAAARREILQDLAEGQIHLMVGTHALLSDGVNFHNLGLVVTDEQHRFGVAQRAKLSQKSHDAHVLVMSATPIPRTLSLIIFGDLSLSVLDEKPPGRQTVETLLISSSKRARAIGFIRDGLDDGNQAYIVCPLIEQGEMDTGLKPAVEYANALAEGELKGYRMGLLHGKMKPKDKDETMRRFQSGEIQALVSTTVVEVGVNVPGATIILIENAERFGLSQLHQLRGRVGRSSKKSWCILVSDSRSPLTRSRLQVMKTESDGFKIAEHDLKLRGPGDFFGYRQHGLPALKLADLADNLAVMETARQDAEDILREDPDLALPQHRLLGKETASMLKAVGERPN